MRTALFMLPAVFLAAVCWAQSPDIGGLSQAIGYLFGYLFGAILIAYFLVKVWSRGKEGRKVTVGKVLLVALILIILILAGRVSRQPQRSGSLNVPVSSGEEAVFVLS